ncbi:MAG: C25 family cysteine peptidase, partial [Polyangiales bacterium]
LGVFDLFGRTRHTITVPMQGLAAELENELIVQQHVAGEAPPSLFVDAVEVDYVRFALADGPAFEFGRADDGAQSVSGLSSEIVYLYDSSNPSAARYYGPTTPSESGELSFAADDTALRFVAVSPESIHAPSEIRPRFASDLRSTEQSADYLIIAASHLLTAAETLAEYREADGYRVLLADIEDVYWEFADGEPDPIAIRDFLRFAHRNWETGPRFVTLVGKGSLDYRDLQGLGGNWVPPALAMTEGGLFPSDSLLADVVGYDAVPDIAIGRLPISSGEELRRILSAIEAFEADHEAMGTLFAADNSEHREFADAARILSTWTSAERLREIDLNSDGLEEARARLFSIWGESLSWLNYVGHGGLDRMGDEGWLTSDDVPALVELRSRPVVLAWSCNLLRFDIPGFVSIGEALLASGSTAGVFSATGWSNHVDTDALRTALTEATLASDAETLGEAILRGHRAAAGVPTELHRVYMLLGDPALRLRQPKSEPDPEPNPPPSEPPEPPSPAPGASPRSSSGCEIKPPGDVGEPLWPSLALLLLAMTIRRRRA